MFVTHNCLFHDVTLKMVALFSAAAVKPVATPCWLMEEFVVVDECVPCSDFHSVSYLNWIQLDFFDPYVNNVISNWKKCCSTIYCICNTYNLKASDHVGILTRVLHMEILLKQSFFVCFSRKHSLHANKQDMSRGSIALNPTGKTTKGQFWILTGTTFAIWDSGAPSGSFSPQLWQSAWRKKCFSEKISRFSSVVYAPRNLVRGGN